MRSFSDNHRMLLGFIALLAMSMALNVTLWSSVRDTQTRWNNVPPTPSLAGALLSSLGDPQLAYRGYGVMIQNMGDTGGRVISRGEYDYEALGRWFRLQHQLDSRSSFTPFFAGYFFGGLRGRPEKLAPIVDYLELAAGDGAGQKWRFMSQAVFIARYRMNDMNRALELAHKLAAYENPDMTAWARQMPVFILTAQGEKQAAYDMMVNILKTESASLHPNEVNATLAYICERILSPHEAALDPLCKDVK